MNMSERIDRIIQQMDSTKLSKTLPQLYPIAIECQDYEGFVILFFWEKSFIGDKAGNGVQYDEAIHILQAAGVDSASIEAAKIKGLEKYLSMRSINEHDVCSLSAREMEDYFSRTEKMIQATEPPKELNPVDLYFRSQDATNAKFNILKNRQDVEKQYAILQGFMTSKLTCYRFKVLQKERQKDLESSIKNSKKVFIIHGHNEAKRRELDALLKSRFGLEPIVLSEQPDQGLTIIEKFEKYASQCSYAFALFTPDDIISDGDTEYFQARPNVIFELGWFYANLGRSRVCILDQASEKSRIFSDLQGVMRVQFNNDVSEKYLDIERELKSVGII